MAHRATTDELARWLAARADFVILGHVMPDGDAMGSCIAMALALRAMGKRAVVCLPGGAPRIYAKYAHADEVLRPEDALPFEPKTALSLDVSEIERLGNGRRLFDGCAEKAMADHHATNPGFGDAWYIDGYAAATGEIVLELIEKLGVTLTQDMAQWLYIAISTDCGQFGYSNTRPETMRAAAKLMETGIDVSRLVRELYHTRSRARTQLLGAVLAQLHVSEDGKIAWSKLTQAMLDSTGALREDNEGIVNYLLEIEGVEIALLAEERGSASKFSLRSKEKVDVAAQVAAPLGGGGHARAAGCTLQTDLDSALETMLKQARAALEQTGEVQ